MIISPWDPLLGFEAVTSVWQCGARRGAGYKPGSCPGAEAAQDAHATDQSILETSSATQDPGKWAFVFDLLESSQLCVLSLILG